MTRIVAFDDEAQTEIEQFRQEIIERTGDPGQAECLSDQDPLREVLNTVGVEGRLADSTSRAVSVLMLTERWDARSATHILSVRCRHSASLRTGGRPRPAPPVPRSERRDPCEIYRSRVSKATASSCPKSTWTQHSTRLRAWRILLGCERMSNCLVRKWGSKRQDTGNRSPQVLLLDCYWQRHCFS